MQPTCIEGHKKSLGWVKSMPGDFGEFSVNVGLGINFLAKFPMRKFSPSPSPSPPPLSGPFLQK